MTFFRLTTFLDYTRMLAYLAMFGYIHQENETPLSTAITGKQALLLFLFVVKPGSHLCNKHNTSDISISTR